MITIKDITDAIEAFAPRALQESYDNAGMQVGEPSLPATGALLCLDVTEAIIDEAIALGVNLIVSHHPLLFNGLKSIIGKSYIERIVMKALRYNIAIYAAHTNLDAVAVNHRWAEKLGLTDVRPLRPVSDMLLKLVVYVPTAHAERLREALYAAGAGSIGDYDCCSYTTEGVGTFRAGADAHPYCGSCGELHSEPESRVEVVMPRYLRNRVEAALMAAHPYEEPAYDIIALLNDWQVAGSGVVGNLPEAVDALTFLQHIKQVNACDFLRHTANKGDKVRRVALCGGSGAFLIGDAVAAGADLFVTSEISYHRFLEQQNKMILAEIGHYESEQHTKEIFCDVIRKKFPTFATYLTKVETNPIKYL